MITYAAQPPAVNADKILNEGLAVMGVSHPDNNDAQNEIMMNKTFVSVIPLSMRMAKTEP